MKRTASKNKKKWVIFAAVFVFLLIAMVAAFSAKKPVARPDPKQSYEVAVLLRDQGDVGQENPNNLQTGDALICKKAGNAKWSASESLTYLILKMELTDDEFAKLCKPVIRQLNDEEIKDELERFRVKTHASEEDVTRYKSDLKEKTVKEKGRAYRIDLGKFPAFHADSLMYGQPYRDKVFDWGIVVGK